MPSFSNILYYFSIIFFSFLTLTTAAYFLTQAILNVLVEGIVMFLIGTLMAGFVVVNQLASFVN